MRPGVAIGGAFLMLFGGLLFLTMVFTPLGVIVGLAGFIMILIGVSSPASPQTTARAPRPPPPPPPPLNGMKNCPNCGWSMPENARYCAHCGKLQELHTKEPEPPASLGEPGVLAICPNCKNRIPSESKFCPECGTDLQPKKESRV